jgi:hypothetical protein
MNLLELIPGISNLLDKFIPDPEQKQNFINQASQLEIQKMEAENERFSLMAGPLRLILYGLALYFFAVWLGPMFGFTVPPMPSEMYGVCKWILAFLIPSETFTVNDIQAGAFRSPVGKGLMSMTKTKRGGK